MYWIIGGLVAFMGLLFFQNIKVPTLGVEGGKFKPLSSKPNGVSTQTTSKSKHVDPISFSGGLEAVMQKLTAVVSGMEGAEIKTQTENYLYAVYTTPLMRFRDDVEIFVDGEKSLVHFRSASRAGHSDLGANKKRYLDFTKKFNETLLEQK